MNRSNRMWQDEEEFKQTPHSSKQQRVKEQLKMVYSCINE